MKYIFSLLIISAFFNIHSSQKSEWSLKKIFSVVTLIGMVQAGTNLTCVSSDAPNLALTLPTSAVPRTYRECEMRYGYNSLCQARWRPWTGDLILELRDLTDRTDEEDEKLNALQQQIEDTKSECITVCKKNAADANKGLMVSDSSRKRKNDLIKQRSRDVSACYQNEATCMEQVRTKEIIVRQQNALKKDQEKYPIARQYNNWNVWRESLDYCRAHNMVTLTGYGRYDCDGNLIPRHYSQAPSNSLVNLIAAVFGLVVID